MESLLQDEKIIDTSKVQLTGYQIEKFGNPGNNDHRTAEIVSFNGKQYRLYGRTEYTSDLDIYNRIFDQCNSQGKDWIIVENFSSESNTEPCSAFFIELSEKPSPEIIDISKTHQEAVQRLSQARQS